MATEPQANPCVSFRSVRNQLEEAVHKSRYVVMNQNGEWQIRNAHSHVTATFPSKVQALCAAIELAEKDGGTVMPPRFSSVMRTIASSRSGYTGKICIRMKRHVRLAGNSRDAVALDHARRWPLVSLAICGTTPLELSLIRPRCAACAGLL